MPSADQLFPIRSIRSHTPSPASLLPPHRMNSLISVKWFPHASHHTEAYQSRRHSLSSGSTHSRLRLPPSPTLLLPPTFHHQAHPAHQRRSHRMRRASRRPTADLNNNKARSRTGMTYRWPVILTPTCLALRLRHRRRRRPTRTTPISNNH